MSLDERSLRRPEFDPQSVPIDFPGRGTWYLPRPRVTYRRERDEGGNQVTRRIRDFGPEYDSLVEAFNAAKTVEDTVTALFDLASDLIRRNYEIGDDDLYSLLVYEVDVSAGGLPEPWDSIFRVAATLPPKSNAAG